MPRGNFPTARPRPGEKPTNTPARTADKSRQGHARLPVSGAGLGCRRLVPAACVAGADAGMMLLVPLPAWLALGILQLPLSSAQVRTLMFPLQSPCRSTAGGFSAPLSPPPAPHHHLGVGDTAQPQHRPGCPGLAGTVMRLFACSSKMLLNPARASELLLSTHCWGRTRQRD